MVDRNATNAVCSHKRRLRFIKFVCSKSFVAGVGARLSQTHMQHTPSDLTSLASLDSSYIGHFVLNREPGRECIRGGKSFFLSKFLSIHMYILRFEKSCLLNICKLT